MGFGDIGRSTVPGRRRRRSSGQGATAIDLSAGIAGISQLAGNRALLSMIARRKGAPGKKFEWLGADGDGAPAEAELEQEKALALLRLLLDESEEKFAAAQRMKDADRAFKDVKEHVQHLIAALHGALEADPDYDGALEEEFERLKRVEEKAGEHRLDGIAEMLEKLVHDGEKAHAKLVDQLDAPDAAGVGADLVNELERDLARLREKVESDEPTDRKRQKLFEKAAFGGGPKKIL